MIEKPQRKPLKPTSKQRRAVKIMVDKGMSASGAMREAGYSVATSKDPGKLTRTEAFQYLMEEMGVSDNLLVDTLKNGMQATKDNEPDHAVRHKFLETGLKLKGYSKNDATNNMTFINIARDQRATYDI